MVLLSASISDKVVCAWVGLTATSSACAFIPVENRNPDVIDAAVAKQTSLDFFN